MSVEPIDIAAAFVDLLDGVEPIRSTYATEPENLGLLPSVTLQSRGVSQVGQDTGGVDLEWSWRVAVYVSTSGGREATQRALLEAITPVVAVPRDFPYLELPGVSWARIDDDGRLPEFNDSERWAVKEFTLRVRVYSAHN